VSRAREALLAGAAVVALTLPLGAAAALLRAPHASRLELQDPRDGGAPLDIKEVDAGLERGQLTFSVVTWSGWRTRSIVDRGYLVVHLDPRSGRRYYALLRSNRRRMIGILLRKRAGDDARIATLKVWRANGRSVSVRIPAQKLKLGPPATQYAWRVQTLVTGRSCKRVCFDRAPDDRDALDSVPGP
jgi:hypothetical protein